MNAVKIISNTANSLWVKKIAKEKGWTKEASKIIGVKTNRVRSWIKKHDIEFFKIIKEKEVK